MLRWMQRLQPAAAAAQRLASALQMPPLALHSLSKVPLPPLRRAAHARSGGPQGSAMGCALRNWRTHATPVLDQARRMLSISSAASDKHAKQKEAFLKMLQESKEALKRLDKQIQGMLPSKEDMKGSLQTLGDQLATKMECLSRDYRKEAGRLTGKSRKTLMDASEKMQAQADELRSQNPTVDAGVKKMQKALKTASVQAQRVNEAVKPKVRKTVDQAAKATKKAAQASMKEGKKIGKKVKKKAAKKADEAADRALCLAAKTKKDAKKMAKKTKKAVHKQIQKGKQRYEQEKQKLLEKQKKLKKEMEAKKAKKEKKGKKGKDETCE